MAIGSSQWMYSSGDYEIDQSLRFNDDDGSYLSRTFPSAGNRKTWTFSAWVKRTNLSLSGSSIFSAGVSSGARGIIDFNNTDTLRFGFNNGSTWYIAETTAKFRDTSAWYHILVKCDLANTTAIIYVNNVAQATNSVSWPNADNVFNNNVFHAVGKTFVNGGLFDGYMGEVNFIDGQALTPDSFGETGDYGEWKPTKYAGAYGTNGFYLPFKQDYSVEGFSTVVYEGNGATQYIGGTGFQPDFVWIKGRSFADFHTMYDAVRGATKSLSSNMTTAEVTRANSLTGFSSDGFTVGNDGVSNNNGKTLVAWNWDMGGTTASNTSGTINSSVRANQAYGQSIVKYTGTGSNATVGHGLSYAPDMIICKSDTNGYDWPVYHSALASAAHVVTLNLTSAQEVQTNKFNSTAPTSSVFSVGTHGTNVSSKQQIAYCFNSVTGYSKFSSYEGTGGTHAITLGFSPAFVMIKNIDAASSWSMWDNTRNPTNPVTQLLRANTTGVEETKTDREPSFTATGFTIGDSDADTNASGQTYVYMAFADTREYAYWLDQSGNNNDWTSEGGLTESDVMVDSPTNNFCTLNTLDMNIDSYAITVSEGNLQAAGPSEGRSLRGTMGMQSGKWYWEVCTTVSGVYNVAGIAKNSSPLNAVLGNDANGYTMFSQSGAKFNNGSTSSYGSAWNAAGNICGIAFDADNGTLVFYVNNSSQGTAFTGLTSGDFLPALAVRTGKAVVNFGQDSSFAGNKAPQGNQDANGIGDFYYQPPSGYLALCTKSLPEVDVIPSEHFNPVIYTGNGTSSSSSQAINTVGFQPDFTWIKIRAGQADSHSLTDSVRGVSKHLRSDTTNGEIADQHLTSFDTNGFTLRGDGGQSNNNNFTYVSWNWKAGGSASSNSNGTVNSSVSANVDAGFSIVAYTGNGANDGTGQNSTVGHGLAKKPELIIRKDRDTAVSWVVQSTLLGSGNMNLALFLNTTSAQDGGQGYMNNTAPTASVFTLGNQTFVNVSGRDYISYCFHSVDGYSKVGKYVGNGNANGPMVNCGFRPAFVLIKRSNAAQDWYVWDTKTSPVNPVAATLSPNSSGTEGDRSSLPTDVLSNGFKIRNTSIGWNGSGDTYIFIAFAESPFKNSNAR